ncbi:MAG: PQQ-binding-like beta-propeller repeat protein [Chitinophagales bacterium]|nr:PQQ-binding-like beta-propeller repeat protein [Chitinophagales bacterium]
MNKIIFAIFLLTSISAFSQKNKIQVSKNEKIFGKSLNDGSDIKGVEYVFPDRIHETYLDTSTGFLTIQLRGVSKNGKWLDNTGKIVQFDIKNEKVLWSKKIVYEVNKLQQFNKTIIKSTGNKSYCLDINTGNELWEVKNNIYYVNPTENIGVGYKFKITTGYTNELEGINLKNGNILWKRSLNRDYGWNDVFYTNDTTMIVVAAGLHAINLKTGKGWDYNTKTGEKNYNKTIAKNAVGVAAGLLTGTFLMSTGHDLVRDLVSNTLVDSSFIYFASKEQIVKTDKQTGEIIWKFVFSKDLTSKSSIFIKNDIIYMVNKGMAYMGNKSIDYGKPFFAAFDKQTGRAIFISILNAQDDPILNFHVKNEEILFVCKNNIKKYSMNTGIEIFNKEFPNDIFGELKYFIGDNVLIRTNNDEFLNIHQSDTTKTFVFTNQGQTLALDENLNVTRTLEYEDLNIFYDQTEDFKCIVKDNNMLILNNKWERIAEIEATSTPFIIDNKLYDIKDKNFTIIDLSKISELNKNARRN